MLPQNWTNVTVPVMGVWGEGDVALYLAFSAWHSPWEGKLTQAEIDHYMEIIEKLPLPEEENQAISSRIRPWAEADDGKPVYMFNLIHFFPELRTFPGAPEFKGTPEEANSYYEKSITWLWLSHAAYPIFGGGSQAKNLINMQPEREWGRVAIARYPNRRTFLKLLSDPAYAPMEPYKFIALEIYLVPVSGDMVIPDVRWVVGGGFVVIFLLVGWVRAARRGNRKSTSRKAAYMKMNKCIRFTAALAALIAAMTTSALAQKLDLATTTAIAEEAYIYGFPLVLNYKVFHDTFIDASAHSYKGLFNQIHNEARVYTPKDTAVQTPNSDSPYSLLGADLRAEPLVLCMPEIEKGRYYSVQMVDMYTHNYGYIGSRTTGNGAGCYLLAGPDWKGETPPGIAKLFRCETPFSLIIFRTQLFSPADIENVKKVQAGYKVQTLSAFLKQPSPPAAPAINWPNATQAMFTTGFPVALDFLLQFLPPTGAAEEEKPLREKFASIGIGPDKKVRLQDLAPEQKAALGEGIKQAFAKIEQAAGALGTHVNGWQIGVVAGSRAFYNGNWLLRAVGSKLGIYGNDAAEATYPFAKLDQDGHPLDGSKHKYTVTFPAGQLPPVNAFWSITMYDANSQFPIENPINRYLINAPMLPDLKKNDDGSLTIYVQRDSPGSDKESNWLPAPHGPIFMVMRMYWPKETAPSVLPPGQGTWKPPGIVPVANLNAQRVERPGDKSFEMVVRTDERYGHDGLFQGPRGWPYWNYLEYPKPIQNPNLWPDTQSTYFLARLAMPAGSSLTLRAAYPRARYLKFALYKWEHNTFVSTGEDLAGHEIEPDPGSTNPFQVGANRLAESRHFTLRMAASDAPADAKQRQPNTLYAGKAGGELELLIRIYLPDQGMDGTGWGPASSPFGGRGLPTYEGTLADGTKLTAAQVIEQFARPITGETKQPVTAAQWVELLHAKDNDPTLDPATTPARKDPKWEKYWTLRYSIVGAFETPEERAKIPYVGAMEGGGDPTTQYMFLHLSRKFGPVYVMRGKMPTFPDTYAGAGGKGLEVMPDAQTQYWSLVSCEAAPSGQIVDGLTDMQVPLDEDGNYTIVYSRREDRPKNATLENGVAWIEWSPRGEYTDKATFEATGLTRK